MEIRKIILFVLVFALGAVSVSLIYELGKITSQEPMQIAANPAETIEQTFTAATTGKAVEKSSPGNHIEESQIKVYKDKIELDIENAVWSKFADTNSMDPLLDYGSNGIEMIPGSEDEIQAGDIISYESKSGDIIIHRVIKKELDENGTYFIVKGDNNPVQDPEKVRFSMVKGILVGVIY